MTVSSEKGKKPISRKKRIMLAVLAVILGIAILLLALAAFYINSKMNLLDRSTSYTTGSIDPEDEQLSFDHLDLDYIDVMENGGEIEPPEGEVNVHDEITNILLIGSDEREEDISDVARADSIMLLSINSKENTWKLVSFERGVGVSIPDQGDDWLTHTFAYGGPELLLKTLQDYYKVDVDRYVRINFTIFETGITDIGGVVVDLSEAEAEYMNGIAGEERWEAGPARLDGPTALVYARMRHLDSDWNRVGRQREVVIAAAEQVSTLTASKINLIIDKLLPKIETNLTNAELWQLLFKMPTLLGGESGQMTVPDEDACWGIRLESGKSLIGCDFEAEAQRLDDFLTGKLTEEDFAAGDSSSQP